MFSSKLPSKFPNSNFPNNKFPSNKFPSKFPNNKFPSKLPSTFHKTTKKWERKLSQKRFKNMYFKMKISMKKKLPTSLTSMRNRPKETLISKNSLIGMLQTERKLLEIVLLLNKSISTLKTD